MSTRTKRWLGLFLTLSHLPWLAHAQSSGGGEGSTWLAGLVYSILPFFFLALVLFWFFRRTQTGPRAKRTDEYMERHEEHMERTAEYLARHEQHMQRIEQSFERIAKALERKNTDAA
jgi:Na+/H+ antiporter NhaC